MDGYHGFGTNVGDWIGSRVGDQYNPGHHADQRTDFNIYSENPGRFGSHGCFRTLDVTYVDVILYEDTRQLKSIYFHPVNEVNLETFFGFTYTQILLGLSRTSGLMISAPIFQSRVIQGRVKVLFAMALALVVAPYIRSDLDLNSFSTMMAIVTLIQELLVGLIMGFMVNMAFYAVQIAGYFADTSMGFGIVNVIDPNTGTQMPVMGQFNYILATMIFLAMNGHHTMIRALIQSYEVIKPGMFFIKKEAVGIFVNAFANMFYLGFKIGLPIMGAVFLTDVALGIISKLVPQVNVFVIGFSVKIILGFILLIFFIPVYVMLVAAIFGNSGETFGTLRHMLRQLHM
jgi:flagellar biosynthetic protein FliR